MTAITARSRRPTTESVLMESNNPPPFLGPQDRRLAATNLPGHEEIEEHPDCRQVLLHRGRRHAMSFDVRGDHDRLYLVKGVHAMPLAPDEELRNRVRVSGPPVAV